MAGAWGLLVVTQLIRWLGRGMCPDTEAFSFIHLVTKLPIDVVPSVLAIFNINVEGLVVGDLSYCVISALYQGRCFSSLALPSRFFASLVWRSLSSDCGRIGADSASRLDVSI